jgi:surface antigen
LRILAAFSAKPVVGRPLYRAPGRCGLSSIGRFVAAVAVVAMGFSAGGCSFRMGNVSGKDDKKDDASDITGSISAIGSVVRIKDDTDLTDADMALARNAASDVLTRGQKDASQPWENPETGARGSVTPLASTYTSEGRVCRDFLASYVRGSSEGWLQGAACQQDKGETKGAWEIRHLKPWKRS